MTSMFRYNYSHMCVTCTKDQDIVYINLKPTFINTNNHVIICTQLTNINNTTKTITHSDSRVYQLSRHICVSTTILNKNHAILQKCNRIMQLI